MTETTETTPGIKIDERPWWTLGALPKPVLSMGTGGNDDVWDAYEEAKTIQHSLMCGSSHDDPLLTIFNLAAPEMANYDNHIPSLVGLDFALKQIDALPAEKRRELLFGWDHKPRHERYTRDDVLQLLREEATMAVALRLRWLDRKVAPRVEETFFREDGDVQVAIKFGTAKGEAIGALNDIIAKLEADWDTMVAELPADVRENA